MFLFPGFALETALKICLKLFKFKQRCAKP